MRPVSKSIRLALAIALASCLAALTFAGPASAAEIGATTLEFKELDKGSTFAFLDNPPTTEYEHGFPAKITPGDQIVFTTPLAAAGKKIGLLRGHCIATKTSKRFENAGFDCSGTFVFAHGTLVVSTTIGKGKTTVGAVLGGTGTYANARGTFESIEGKSSDAVTVTLVE